MQRVSHHRRYNFHIIITLLFLLIGMIIGPAHAKQQNSDAVSNVSPSLPLIIETTNNTEIISATPVQYAQNIPSSLQEVYQNWVLRCVTEIVESQPTRICEINQTIRNAQSEQVLLSVSFQPIENGAVVSFFTPFELLLSEGLNIEIADREPLKANFKTCYPVACLAETIISTATLNKMSANPEAMVLMVNSTTGQNTTVAVSFAGFAPAWDRILWLAAQ